MEHPNAASGAGNALAQISKEMPKVQEAKEEAETFHDPNYKPIKSFDEIVLERERGLFGGAVYSLTISGDGKVQYQGKADVKHIGEAQSLLTREEIERLVSEINKVEYSSISASNFLSKCWTDAGYSSTSIKAENRTHKIEHYHGTCVAGAKQLSAFELAIDEIVGTIKWIGTQRERFLFSRGLESERYRNASEAFQSGNVRYLQAYAELGSAPAQHYLGLFYKDSSADNKAEALRWFLRAANQGYKDSQSVLASMYLNGEDIPEYAALQNRIRDRQVTLELPTEEECVKIIEKWFLSDAEKGDVQAQLDIGEFFKFSTGGLWRADYNKAAMWLRKAADSGNATAQDMLASMYAQGHGVPADPVESYFWRRLAAKFATGEDRARYDRISQIAAERLTMYQIQETEHRVQLWQPLTSAKQ